MRCEGVGSGASARWPGLVVMAADGPGVARSLHVVDQMSLPRSAATDSRSPLRSRSLRTTSTVPGGPRVGDALQENVRGQDRPAPARGRRVTPSTSATESSSPARSDVSLRDSCSVCSERSRQGERCETRADVRRASRHRCARGADGAVVDCRAASSLDQTEAAKELSRALRHVRRCHRNPAARSAQPAACT
jgi:hypothetical protein